MLWVARVCARARACACQLYPNMNAWMLLGKFFFCYKAWCVCGPAGGAARARDPATTRAHGPRHRLACCVGNSGAVGVA